MANDNACDANISMSNLSSSIRSNSAINWRKSVHILRSPLLHKIRDHLSQETIDVLRYETHLEDVVQDKKMHNETEDKHAPSGRFHDSLDDVSEGYAVLLLVEAHSVHAETHARHHLRGVPGDQVLQFQFRLLRLIQLLSR